MEDKKSKLVIEDTEEHFPNRFLTREEKLLLIAKIIRYTSSQIANTLPPEIRLETKLADSNMIERLLKHCPEEDAKDLFLNIGALIRVHLTRNPELLGLVPAEQSRIIH